MRYLDAKPYGVDRVEIAWPVSDTVIDSPGQLTNHETFSRNPWEHTFGHGDRAKKLTARRAAALARSSYANGVVTQLAVTEAVNKLDEASLGLQNAIFEYRAAWYDWELAASTPAASMPVK